jgi:hypothetical protein
MGDLTKGLTGPFTIICLEQDLSDVTAEKNLCVYSFKHSESADAFVKGRRLEQNEYVVVGGPIIKNVNEILQTPIEEKDK